MPQPGKKNFVPQHPADAEWKLITLVTPTKIESLNVTLRNDRRHWTVNWRMKNAIQKEIFCLVHDHLDALERAMPGTIRQVKITSVRKNFLDKDNLLGACKPWFDALKTAGVLEDDDPSHANLSADQRHPNLAEEMEDRRPEPSHTEIEIVFLARK